MASLTVPNSLISESFRQIRTNVMFSGPSESRKVLLVTSPSPDDGRSTVAVNLAATMTAGGRKVLLVDANFRQPAVGTLFGNCPDGGLSSALVGEGKWEELIAEVEPGLWVMGAGPLPPNPAELLDSEQMRQLLTEMSGQFDQVIIDGPPSIVVSDANILAGQSDGVILVVRAGDNTYGLVQRCRDNLERIGAHILGAVLNGVRVSAGGYLRRNYTTFYDYHAQGKLPQK
jgi:capsular exopolysaccharide synthesis family protein